MRMLLLSLLVIYVLLALPLRSYTQPLIVMLAVPFGLVGAIFGHWLLGFDVTMLSLFGIFGLSGIVINDSIILTVFFKQYRDEGMSALDAAIKASSARLRAVLLTSLTTIVGILPLLFETALEAQFLKPMVISISFGLAFGTFIVLLLLPAFLTGIESLRQVLARVHSDFRARLPDIGAVLNAGRARRMTQADPTASPGTGGRRS